MQTLSSPARNALWADILLAADAASEPFQDVHVVTLKSYFLDVVYEQAINEVISTGFKFTEPVIRSIARMIIEKYPPSVSERVIFSSDGHITVVVDVPQVDDDTVFKVMEMLSTATKGNMTGTVELGFQRTYGIDVLMS
jgi:hypothetical protein